MERRSPHRDKGPVLAAVIALLILGAGSVFLTWQNIRRQRELVDQHLLLSAGAVLHGVEANLMRVMHGLSRSPDLAQRLFPTIKEIFQEKIQGTDKFLVSAELIGYLKWLVYVAGFKKHTGLNHVEFYSKDVAFLNHPNNKQWRGYLFSS